MGSGTVLFMWREQRLCGSAVVLAVLSALSTLSTGCRGAEFRLAEGGGGSAPDTESCVPEPDSKVGADCGVFVRPGAAGDGSLAAPVGSIMEALALGERIYVCGDLADESINISATAEIIGGLDCDSWAYDLDVRTELTAPAGQIPISIAPDATVIMSGFRIASRNALLDSGSSIAVIAQQGSSVSFERCDIVAGNASAGADGAPGVPGEPGEEGEPGTPSAGGTGGLSSCLSEGGKGGNAGTSPTANGSTGLPAEQGNGGDLGCTMGGSGVPGMLGDNALQFNPVPTIDATGYSSEVGESGAIGTRGGGGGGGGGIVGAGGGGGGAGGCPGAGGGPGGFGGASIAIVSLGAALSFQDSTAFVGNGGDGGVGGVGGNGGLRGSAGSGYMSACAGGDGGDGGAGGDGADGVGGPSLIVAYLGAEPSLNGLSVTAPSAGQAGQSPSGDAAPAATTLSFDDP